MFYSNLEVCVDSVESACCAAHGGATRLELCAHLTIGGTTPTTSLIELVKESVAIPVNVLIRPRFGDFLYSNLEYELIKRDILTAKKHLADGVVIGILTANGHLDTEKLKVLIDLARPMHVTLHRAFDMCVDPLKALDEAIELGFDTILTSGQAATALEGASLLKLLVEKADGRIEIMPGCGIKASHLDTLIQITHATSFHLSAKTTKESGMIFRNTRVSMGLPGLSEYTLIQTSTEEVARAKQILDSIKTMQL